MESYMSEMMRTFHRDHSISSFNALTALELTTLPTIMKEVYGEPVTEEKEEDEDNVLVKGLKFAGSTAKGFGTGVYDVGEETVVGIYNTVAHPIQTGTAMWDAVSHPIDTSKYIGNAIAESYDRDMANGDAESRSHWVTYALGITATSIFGTKGAGTVTKAGTTTAKTGAAAAKTGVANASKKVSEFDMSNLFPFGPQYQVATGGHVPFNVVDGKHLKDQLILKAESLDAKGTGDVLENKRVTIGKEIIAERALEAEIDLTPKLTPFKSLGRVQQKRIKEKIENRTVTKEEYKRYQWDKRFSKRRAAGVNEFWKQEKKRIINSESTTRNWTNEQMKDILKGKKSKYNDRPIIGHHTYNAMNYPHISTRGELIYPVTNREHLKGWHGGSYSRNAPGVPVNPNFLEEF